MAEYTRLRKELESYFEMSDVELNENQISAYDLYKIVNDKLHELRKIQFESTFKDEINKGFIITKKVSKLFKKEESSTGKRCTTVMTANNCKTSTITFGFSKSNHIIDTEYLTICRDIDSDEIYFDKYSFVDKAFVMKHYDCISETFNTLEEFSKLFQGGVGTGGNGAQQVFTDGFLEITLSYDSYGRIDTDIKIDEKEDKEDIYNRDWLKRKKLSEYVFENKETILRKIPINIDELNYTTKTIVEGYLSKINVPQKKIGGK